jgi:hypothetical protein
LKKKKNHTRTPPNKKTPKNQQKNNNNQKQYLTKFPGYSKKKHDTSTTHLSIDTFRLRFVGY